MACVIRTDVAVLHHAESSLEESMVFEKVREQDVDFIKIPPSSYRLKSFIRSSAMVDRIRQLRNRKVDFEMKKVGHDVSETDGVDMAELPMPKRPRRALADEIPKILTITIQLIDGSLRDLRVLSCFHQGTPPAIELTQDGVALLSETPIEDEVVQTHQPNVKWAPQSQAVYCLYRTSTGERKRKQENIDVPGEVGLFTERIKAASERIQKFYEDYHVPIEVTKAAIKEELKEDKQFMWM